MHAECSGWHDQVDDYIDWINYAYEDPKMTTEQNAAAVVRTAAAKVTGHQAAVEGSERAMKSWTKTEQLLVRTAIIALAEERDLFTADDVWALLGKQVPKTAGLAAMFRQAKVDGYISPTDQYADSARSDRSDHDQGRRLRVWRSACRD